MLLLKLLFQCIYCLYFLKLFYQIVFLCILICGSSLYFEYLLSAKFEYLFYAKNTFLLVCGLSLLIYSRDIYWAFSDIILGTGNVAVNKKKYHYLEVNSLVWNLYNKQIAQCCMCYEEK